jgi:hypothetical protein
MKDELISAVAEAMADKSELEAEIWKWQKNQDKPIFLPNLSFCHSFPLAANRASQSK